MIDWGLVAKIACGGYGVAILVLSILAIFTWVMGLAVQRFQKVQPAPGKETGKPKARVGGAA